MAPPTSAEKYAKIWVCRRFNAPAFGWDRGTMMAPPPRRTFFCPFAASAPLRASADLPRIPMGGVPSSANDPPRGS